MRAVADAGEIQIPYTLWPPAVTDSSLASAPRSAPIPAVPAGPGNRSLWRDVWSYTFEMLQVVFAQKLSCWAAFA